MHTGGIRFPNLYCRSYILNVCLVLLCLLDIGCKALLLFVSFSQADIQRMRLELSRLAQERDSYKQKCEAMHRVNQQHNHQQHQPPPSQQQQQQPKNGTGNRTDSSTNYYL